MGVRYLWDTNSVIYYLQKQLSNSAETFLDEVITLGRPAISVITEIELLCWTVPTTTEDFAILEHFIQEATIYSIDQKVKIHTIDIRKRYRIKLPDALIAATALANNMELISSNLKDFRKIEELAIVDTLNLR